MTMYNTNSPITREERNNINATWQDILGRFANLQYQIKLLAGGEEVNELLHRIEKAIQNAETAVQSYITQVDENVQQSLVTVNELISELTVALHEAQQAIDNANLATTNANDAATAANNKVAEATQLLTALELLQHDLQQMKIILTQIASNAQDATQDAIQATGAANTATANAQSAADNANDATTAATVAASRANTAAEAVEGWGTAAAWSSTINYVKNNVVTDEGSTWQALRPNNNVKPIEGADWTCIARKGIDGKGAVSTVNQKPPTEDGNINVEMQDIEGLNVAISDLEALVESIVQTGVAKLVRYSYTIQATTDGQTEIEIPLTIFDQDTDTVLLVRNSTVLYEIEDYSISNRKITLTEPVISATNTSFYLLILKNVPTGEEGGVSGGVITDGSIAKRKLEQTLQDEIGSKANHDDLMALEQQVTMHLDNEAMHLNVGERNKITNAVQKALGYHSQDNANLIGETSVYNLTSSGLNGPPSSSDGWATIFTAAGTGSTDRAMQFGQKWNDNWRTLWYRKNDNGANWGPWYQFSLINRDRANGVNLNDYIIPGTYAMGYSLINAPEGGEWSTLQVYRSVDAYVQKLYGLGSSYIRYFIAGSWTSWKLIVQADTKWVDGTLANGWTGVFKYRPMGNLVQIIFDVTSSGVVAEYTPIGYLPTNYISSYYPLISMMKAENSRVERNNLIAFPDGRVLISNNHTFEPNKRYIASVILGVY